MPFYVLALTDTGLAQWTAGRRTLQTLDIGGIHAVYERRVAPPALTDDELREQHGLVIDIARRVRAVLPVRFGALVEKPALLTLVRDHEAEIRLGLEEVRDRVQMTLRIMGNPPPRKSAGVPASTGRAYLEQRRLAASPTLPPAARSLLVTLGPLIARERQAPGAGRLRATVYHLVDAANVARYTRLVTKAASSTVLVTGPWPPFAFTPQLW